MKQIIVKKKVFKIAEEDLPFNIPTEPMCLFMYGSRISIKIVPVYTTWKKMNGEGEEEIWSLDILVVSGGLTNHIEKITVHISSIGDILREHKSNVTSRILELMNEPDERNLRTPQEFKEDFDIVYNKMKELL